MKIKIINGANIFLLGKREPSIYGSVTFEDYLAELRKRYADLEIDYFQSNIEGEMIDCIQQVGFDVDGIILNAGAYTHTSIALQDAILTEYLPDLSAVLLDEGIITAPVTAVVRKGKERFVCDARLAERTSLVQPSRKRQRRTGKCTGSDGSYPLCLSGRECWEARRPLHEPATGNRK